MRHAFAAVPESLVERSVVITGSSDAPAVEVTNIFTFQSYFDDTLGPAAILAQPTNEAIVPSTKARLDLSGYAVGLHPSSETPVAVAFKSGEQQGSSTAYRLKPGQVIRPFGAPGKPGRFSGIEWGLPFGWLGGGSATLVVFRTDDANVQWLDHNEVVYHRVRLPIYQPAAVPAAVVYNWPQRFPWTQATFGANALNQRGRPALAIQPTRTLLRLRTATLAADASMRVYFIGSDVFAQSSTGAISLTDVAGLDVIWGTWASIASANFATQYQTQMLTGEMERLAANDGGIFLVDGTGAAALNGLYVDIVRYGRL